MVMKTIKELVMKDICIGYDLTMNELKAECIIDVEEVIDLVLKDVIKLINMFANSNDWMLVKRELKSKIEGK